VTVAHAQRYSTLQCIVVCFSVFQCAAVCHSVLQCVAVWWNEMQCAWWLLVHGATARRPNILREYIRARKVAAVCVLQCVLQCVVVCSGILLQRANLILCVYKFKMAV